MTDQPTNPTPTTPAQPAAPSDYRGPDVSMNVTIADHSALTASDRTVSEADLCPTFYGIFKDARTKLGMRATELTPETIIGVPRSDGRRFEMTIAAAERAGLVVRDATTGEYREISAEERTAKNQPKGTAHNPATLPDQIEANVSEFVRAFHALGRDHVSVVATWLGRGDLSVPPPELEEIARRSSTPLDQLHAAWHEANRAFARQASGVFTAAGLDANEVWDWAEQTVPRSQLNSARLHQYAAGDLRGWKAIADAFIRKHGVGRGAREASGAPVPQNAHIHTDPSGRQFVRIQLPSGKTSAVSVQNAKNLGWM